jgi:hypothetical protein
MATRGKVMEWQRLVFLPLQSSRVLRDSTHAAQVNCFLLNKEQYNDLEIGYVHLPLWAPTLKSR